MPLPLRMSYNEEITTLSLARPCERSESIQYHLLVIANIVKQSSITYSSLRTQWSNPENKRIGLQLDRHGFASRWPPARHCERSEAIQRISELDYKWIATLTLAMTNYSSIECGDCFTAGNLLKPSANTISQLRICSNRLRRPFHSGEFR